MAKIKNPHLFRFEHFENGKCATVGHNRTVEHVERENAGAFAVQVIKGRLHGHCIFHAETFRTRSGTLALLVILNSHGYQTATTRAAMADFLNAAGIRASVSMARGELRASLVHDDGTHTPWYFSGDVCAHITLNAETLAPYATESANV